MANGDIRLNLRTAGQTQGNSFASVTVKKNLWPLILANLSLAKGSSVAVGWPGEANKTKATHDISGMSNVQVATINEIGSAPGAKPEVPPRPMVKATMQRIEAPAKQLMAEMLKQVASGKMPTKVALGRIGRYAQGELKQSIREPANGTWKPENAPSTIIMKSPNGVRRGVGPLVDTGTLFDSVSYAVRMKGKQ